MKFTQFTEIHGMVLLGSLAYVERGLGRLQSNFVPFPRWRYERFANHVHGTMSNPDREHIREEMTILAGFEEALQQRFPRHTFVISHIPCYAVTFYQLIDDAPTNVVSSGKSLEKAVWCQACQCDREYSPLPEPDTEFPWLKWGSCVICHNDLLLNVEETCRIVKAT